MAHVYRFYVPDLDPACSVVDLPDEEVHHALHVARVRKEETVQLFNGNGLEAVGSVAHISRKEVQIVVQTSSQQSPPQSSLTLLQAWLHRDKSLEDIIRRGVEIGVAEFLFFPAQRSERFKPASEKWSRIAIESCKQCGRSFLPRFKVAETFDEACLYTPESVSQLTRFIAVQKPDAPPLRKQMVHPVLLLLVGPEGGFTEEEIHSSFDAGFLPLSLGATTYRAEVASLLAVSLIQYELGELGPIG